MKTACQSISLGAGEHCTLWTEIKPKVESMIGSLYIGWCINLDCIVPSFNICMKSLAVTGCIPLFKVYLLNVYVTASMWLKLKFDGRFVSKRLSKE